MPWLVLILAGCFEVAWAIGLKQSQGFTKLWPSLWTVACMAISFVLLAWALKHIPVGTGYAVWTGIGAAGTAVLGILWFEEPANAGRVASLFLIVAGVVGLKLFSA